MSKSFEGAKIHHTFHTIDTVHLTGNARYQMLSNVTVRSLSQRLDSQDVVGTLFVFIIFDRAIER